MPQATTLGSPGKAVTFNYTGNILSGVVIKYNYANVSIDRNFLNLILITFRGKKILAGFSETNPTPNGFGEWIRDNSKHNSELLTPRHAVINQEIFPIPPKCFSPSVRNDFMHLI